VVPAEQDRPDIARKRRRWKAHQGQVDPRRLVFIDETWIKTNMAPLRGWGPKGLRLACQVPHGHWQTLTFLAALRHDRVDAPCVIDGPINGVLFIFLPPYSPDLNPIEQLFAKLKHWMRNAQERDHEATWRRVGQLLDLVSPAECANYLRNAGYASV
jgi:hypothetical protein